MEDIAKWVAPIATTVAALMTASNLGARITGWGFVVFTVGSLAWLTLGIVTEQPNLLWQNVILTLLNLFGIWLYISGGTCDVDWAKLVFDNTVVRRRGVAVVG